MPDANDRIRGISVPAVPWHDRPRVDQGSTDEDVTEACPRCRKTAEDAAIWFRRAVRQAA